MCAIKINEIEAKMSDSQRQDLVRWALRECDAWKSDLGGASCCRRSVESCLVVALDWELVGSYYPSRISIHWPLEWNAVCLNQISLELQPWHLLLASPFLRVGWTPMTRAFAPSSLADVPQEIQKSLAHPRIVQLKDCYALDSHAFVLVLELLGTGQHS